MRKYGAVPLLLAGSLLAALAGRHLHRLLWPPEPIRVESHLPALFPAAERFDPREGDPPRYLAWGRGAGGRPEVLGIAWLSSDVLPPVRGYAGPLHVLAGMAPDGTLTPIRVVRHQETPSYAAAIERPEYGGSFAGRKPGDSFRPGEDVDAVTRATITSEAVARAVRDSSRIVAAKVLGLPVPPPAGASPRPPWGRVAAVVAATLAALVHRSLRAAWHRRLLAAGAVVILGFWLGIYLSLGQVAALLAGQPPPLLAHLDWYLLLLISLASALTLGNLFCQGICPFGHLQELLGAAARGAGIGGWAVRDPGDASRLRWAYLWLTLMAALALGLTDAANYEPFATAFDGKGGALRWLLLGVVLVGATLVPRLWCRFLCPVGALLDLLARSRPRPASPDGTGDGLRGEAAVRTPARPG